MYFLKGGFPIKLDSYSVTGQLLDQNEIKVTFVKIRMGPLSI